MARKRISISLALPETNTGECLSANVVYHPAFAIASIQVSPGNPRKRDLIEAGITRDVVAGLARKDDETFEQFANRIRDHIDQNVETAHHQKWEAFIALSVSIGQGGGVIQPIRIISGNPATIDSGERRFLASIMAGLTHIRAIETSHANDFDELVENTLREELSLRALAVYFRAHNRVREKPFSVSEISLYTGLSRGSAHTLQRLIATEEDSQAWLAILNGEASTLNSASKWLPNSQSRNQPVDSIPDESASTDNDNNDQYENILGTFEGLGSTIAPYAITKNDHNALVLEDITEAASDSELHQFDEDEQSLADEVSDLKRTNLNEDHIDLGDDDAESHVATINQEYTHNEWDRAFENLEDDIDESLIKVSPAHTIADFDTGTGELRNTCLSTPTELTEATQNQSQLLKAKQAVYLALESASSVSMLCIELKRAIEIIENS